MSEEIQGSTAEETVVGDVNVTDVAAESADITPSTEVADILPSTEVAEIVPLEEAETPKEETVA